MEKEPELECEDFSLIVSSLSLTDRAGVFRRGEKHEQVEGQSLLKEAQTIYDARSAIYREVYGFPSRSVQISRSRSVDLQNENAVILVEDKTNPLCQTTEAICYSGDLSELNEDDISYPEDVSFSGLRFLLDQERITLIDVRNETELEAAGQIPGSFNVPLHEITEAFELDAQAFQEKYKFPLPDPKARNTVLTCRSGRRILVAQSKLKPLGYDFLRLYRGSFNEWSANGGEITK